MSNSLGKKERMTRGNSRRSIPATVLSHRGYRSESDGREFRGATFGGNISGARLAEHWRQDHARADGGTSRFSPPQGCIAAI
jgi:hypothetical protein